MKIAIPVLLAVLLVAPAFVLSAWSGSGRGDAESDILVTGVGYPPIKAQSAAQARLMARRAAVLDAYRNALAGTGSPNNDEPVFYSGLSGFVKGMTIEREEYLDDGGVRIIARVPAANISAPPGTPRKGTIERGRGPSSVPLNEWYKIIEHSVRFE